MSPDVKPGTILIDSAQMLNLRVVSGNLVSFRAFDPPATSFDLVDMAAEVHPFLEHGVQGDSEVSHSTKSSLPHQSCVSLVGM